jgi:AraC-like DNA-binding protein
MEGLVFSKNKINKHHSEQICSLDESTHDFASPLFKYGVYLAGIVENHKYDSGISQGKHLHWLFFLIQGKMELTINNEKKIINPNEIVWLPEGNRYRRKTLSHTKWLYICIKSNNKIWNPLAKSDTYIRPYENCMLMYIHLRNILDSKYYPNQHSKSLAISSAEYLTKLLTHEIHFMTKEVKYHNNNVHALVKEIWDNPSFDWTIPKMAAKAHLSSSRFNAVYTNQIGNSPLKTVINARLEMAKSLLCHSEYTLNDIVEKVGYKSVNSFTKLFKKFIGTSPIKYRIRNQY